MTQTDDPFDLFGPPRPPSAAAPQHEARKELHFFWGKGSPFSQHHPCYFGIDGQRFNCSEQYMMYAKAMLFGDAETAGRILASTDPKEQKRLGRQVCGFDEAVWEQHRERIIYQGNHAKFTQNRDLLEALLRTGCVTLVEASPYDCLYGIGLSASNPRATDPQQWRGRNLLGDILTRLRDDLHTYRPSSAQPVPTTPAKTGNPSPPPVPAARPVPLEIINTTPGFNPDNPFSPPAGWTGSRQDYLALMAVRYKDHRFGQYMAILARRLREERTGRFARTVKIEISGPYHQEATIVLNSIIKANQQAAFNTEARVSPKRRAESPWTVTGPPHL